MQSPIADAPVTRDERLLRCLALAVGLLPEGVRRKLAIDSDVRVNGVRLESRTAALVGIAQHTGHGFRDDVSVPAARAGARLLNRAFRPLEPRPVEVRALRIPIDGGTIGARLYRPAQLRGAAPLLVYFHGGGFVTGDLEGYDGLMRLVAVRGKFAVLAVDYRLGPEDRFPSAHEDGFAALSWAQRCARAWDVDPERIAVAGDSAGGGIAAAVGAFAQERGLVKPAFALLIYPSVDATGATPSRAAFTSGVPLTPQAIAWFVRHYSRSPDDLGTPLFAPLRADSLAASPPTYLLAAGFDPLIDEGRLYAERLRAAGVRTMYDLRPGLAHGFVNLAGVVPDARRALLHAIAVTAAELNTPAG